MAGRKRKGRRHQKRTSAPKRHRREEKSISSNMIPKEALNRQKEDLDEEENGKPKPFHSISEIPSVDRGCDEVEDIDGFEGFSETQSQFDGGVEEIAEEDETILAAIMPNNAGPQLDSEDLITQKIKDKDAGKKLAAEARPLPKLDTGVIDLYKGVGTLLSRYTSGKLSKAFEFMPALKLWKEVLYLTEPENWSPNAMYQATRIFSSNVGVKEAEQFYNLFLLPRIRVDIQKNKRLHSSVYQSLKMSLHMPAAFNKGILLPLCQSGTCTRREAVIVASVIRKSSFPYLHASVALLKLAEMKYCGTTSYFIKSFLDKKDGLPYRVLDAIVEHFMRVPQDDKILPLIWHRSLLGFVRSYKNELTKKHKENLEHLLQSKKHRWIARKIRKEMRGSRNRGEEDDLVSISPPTKIICNAIIEDIRDMPEVPTEEED